MSGPPGPVAEVGGGVPGDRAEVAGEVGLIGIPEVCREGGQVGMPGAQSLGRLMQPAPLDEPVRAQAEAAHGEPL